jgi:hypothetical protein
MMALNRREFIKLMGLLAGSITLNGCTSMYQRLAGEPTALGDVQPVDAALFAMLNRMTFGPRPEEVRRIREIGAAGWIEEQLAPEFIDDPVVDLHLRRFSSLSLKANEIFDLYGDKLFDELDTTSAPNELRRATLLRQLYSRRQLNEVMVEFWSDHFHISVEKGDCFYLKTVDERTVIRPHALGSFADLLWASAHSPAMLVYLDNQSNQKGSPNENYAREIMELHTLGVDGGYSQADVMNLARCFTGWTVKNHFWRGDFVFKPELHDTGNKVVLGRIIETGGIEEAEGVILQLASHPSTARFVTTKLARRFLGDDPPVALLQRAIEVFSQSGGDMRAVLRVLLLDGVAATSYGSTGLYPLSPKFKRPLNYLMSALRQLNAKSDGGMSLLDFLARMGQPLFAWPTPDGFPDRNADWVNNLHPRWQFALALAQNQISGTTIDLADLFGAAETAAEGADRLSTLLLGAPLQPRIHQELLEILGNDLPAAEGKTLLLAVLLASPAFQWR